jgi:hypothetical protein
MSWTYVLIASLTIIAVSAVSPDVHRDSEPMPHEAVEEVVMIVRSV